MKFELITSVLIMVQLLLAIPAKGIDNKLKRCIPFEVIQTKTNLAEYAHLQAITDLLQKPLREIARQNAITVSNADYNAFMACSWVTYNYQNRKGQIIFDTIETSLRKAITLQLGRSFSAIKISSFTAALIVNNCTNLTSLTPGRTAVLVHNCLLNQIKEFENNFIYWTGTVRGIPDYSNIQCLPEDQIYNIAQYKNIEVINYLNLYPLADVVSEQNIVSENNIPYQEFLYCVWKHEKYINENDDFNYDVLEKVIKDSIVSIVGASGPAIYLSQNQAHNIINDCRNITGNTVGHKIVKVQNLIIKKLIPFSKLL